MLVSKQETSVDFEGIATLRVVAKANPPVDQAEWSFNGQILDSDRFSAWNYTNVTKVKNKKCSTEKLFFYLT